MKTKTIVILAVFVLIFIGAYLGLSSMSILGDGTEQSGDEFLLPYNCNVGPQECIDAALEDGSIIQSEVADFYELYTLECRDSKCVAVVK